MGSFKWESFWLGVDIKVDVNLGGGFEDFLFSPVLGEMIQFDEHIFQMGWFNHQLEMYGDANVWCS